ncbi:MAG: hypothetical protein ABSA49_06045 [Rhizomicrobium sp.]|jgi:hypothetical protein
MATESATARSFDIGSVLSNTFAVIGHNFITFAVIAAIAGIPGFAFSWLTTGMTPFGRAQFVAPPGMPPTTYVVILFAGGLLGFVFSCVLQAALIHGTVADLNGRRASFADCVATGLKAFLPLAAIAILAGMGMGIGMILLVVPGIILMVAWSVAIPVRVIERKPIFEVFGRSWQLTSGYRWPILGLFIIVGIGSAVLQFALLPLQGIMASSTVGGSVVFLAAATIVGILVSMFGATMAGVMYYELRSAKEGIGPEALAAVFD